ncbi:MAG: domain S-box protein [Chthoniobacteraceae bacterium]|nr:domain S-box protein [Chthoniobacteraceae bacterium]
MSFRPSGKLLRTTLGFALLLLLSGAYLLLPNDGGFMPHAHCYLFNRSLIWLHGASDLLIALAYASIAATLVYLLVRARNGMSFHWLVFSLAAFIVACGATHLMEVWTLQTTHPRYWLSGGIKLITATASVLTAAALPSLVPRLLGLIETLRLSGERKEKLVQSEARYRRIVETASEGIWIVDADLRTTYVNAQLTGILGYSSQEMEGRLALDFLGGLLPAGAQPHIVHRKLGASDKHDLHLRRKDGMELWVILTSSAILDENERFVGAMAMLTDITERKRTEEALKEAQRLAQLGSWSWDAATSKVTWSEEIYRIHGRDMALPPPPTSEYGDCYYPESWARLSAAAQHAIETGTPFELELELSLPDRTPRWVIGRGEVVRDGDGKVIGLFGTTQDITTRKAEQEARRRAEAKYRDIFEYAVDGIFQSSPEGRFIDVNPALARMYGYESVEDVLLTVHDIATQVYVNPAQRLEFIERVGRYGIVAGFEVEIYRKDGTTFWISESARAVRDFHGRIIHYEGTLKDISERKRTEDELYIRDRAIHELGLGVLMSDPSKPDRPAIYVNPAFCQLTGYSAEEVLGRNCRFLQGADTDPAVIEVLRRAVREERTCSVELVNYRKDGTKFWNALSISPVHDANGKLVRFIGVQTDVTAVKLLQEQYQQSQKMEAFGQLAGGVAHDFNNLLTVILGYSNMLLTTLSSESRIFRAIEQIENAGQRAAGLTRQLLAFSRKQTLQPQLLDLDAVVTDVQKMLQRLIGEHIGLQTRSGAGLWTVRADRGQIEQVILNLTVNARDAMPEGGTISIETDNCTLGADKIDPPPGDYVVMKLSDTGTGMSDQVKDHLFEPFFTTKEQGKGTGLGLATCYGIIEQSGGHIMVESQLGSGTSFSVYLPRVASTIVPAPQEIRRPELPRGSETILVVEDDAAVREMTTRLLQRLGYNVLEAMHGGDAQELIRNVSTARIDLVLTDVVMPNMGGKALADWLGAEHSEIKVIFTSGYIDDSLLREDLQNVRFLQKPASPAVLATTIRKVLDQ